jgi:CheY-like chemotaxis protein
LNRLRVLVIDGDFDAGIALGRSLQAAGCEVALAHGLDMGLQLIRETRPMLVFLDVATTTLQACTVVAQLRLARIEMAFAALVCMSAEPTEAERQRCLSAGFDGFYRKPLSRLQLAQALDTARDKQHW